MSKLMVNPLSLGLLSTAASLKAVPGRYANLLLPDSMKIAGRTISSRATRTRVRNRRRRLRRRFNKGIEINKAEGGYKNITLPYRTQVIGINTYWRLAATKIGEDWNYVVQPPNENYASYGEYNVIRTLNSSTEFIDRLKTTSQYRLDAIYISIFLNRMPASGDLLSRLLLFVNTDKVTVIDPKVQNNVMRLNMNTVGTKNFNFRINNANLGKLATEWQNGDDLYNGNVFLHVAQEDVNKITDDTETTHILGTMKMTFRILTRIQDYTRLNDPSRKLTVEEKIDRLEKEMDQMKISQVNENNSNAK